MTKLAPTKQKEQDDINEIFEASKQVKQGYYYTGDLKNIIKNRKNKNLGVYKSSKG